MHSYEVISPVDTCVLVRRCYILFYHWWCTLDDPEDEDPEDEDPEDEDPEDEDPDKEPLLLLPLL